MRNNQNYRVAVGHVSIDVSASDSAQAIVQARRRMCTDMPRLWDVIATLDDSRFVVEELKPSPASEEQP